MPLPPWRPSPSNQDRPPPQSMAERRRKSKENMERGPLRRRSNVNNWGAGRGGPNRVPPTPPRPLTEEQQKEKETQQRRSNLRRQNVSAATQSATDTRQENYVQLTDEQWGRLSPEQKQQVQYNADLKEAVDLDRAAAAAGTPSVTGDDKRSYNSALRSIFGSAKGHTAGMTTAPETVAYLTELGLTQADTKGGGIGNYLNLDAALSVDEIAGLSEIVGNANPVKPSFSSTELTRLRTVSAAASATLAERLASGQALLDGSGLVAEARAARAMEWGGAGGTYEQLGADQAYVDNALDIMAASPSAGDTSGVASGWQIAVDLMNENGVTAERQAVIRRAVNDRVNRAIQGGEWIVVPGANVTLTPGEVAAALGQV